MLRINQQRSSQGAKSYFEEGLAREDYYSKDAIVGHWGGKGAEQLGLNGSVEREAFLALCDNRNPNTGKNLTARTNDNRTVGYDFNLHAPKSLSLLYTLTKDDRLLEAFQMAVRQTMQELEADVKTRVREGGQNAERVTGNLLWAEFVHLTSRPINGVPDPHLHAHCFVFNATHDSVEAKWKAAQFRDVVRDAPYFEAAFHARLSKNVADLGYAIDRTRQGWEVAGLAKATLDKFSRRTAQVEREAREKGITDARAKAELGAKTREKKDAPQSFDTLREEWKSRLNDTERRSIMDVLAYRSKAAAPAATSAEAVNHALEHGFERASAVSERRLLATALKRGYGSVEVENVAAELRGRHEVIRRERDDQTFVTTREVLAEEASALDFARRGRGAVAPLGKTDAAAPPAWLNRDQANAVRHVLTSTDRVMLIRGAAGTGKTTLLKATADAIRDSGHEIQVFAPTSEAARGVLRKEGFQNADTVARFLVDEKLQAQSRGQVIWIDEAGLLGSRDLKKLFAVAEANDARVVLAGDERQHGSVARGDSFRLLQQHAGLEVVDVASIQRQRGEYRAAVEALANGDLNQGLQKLDRMGAIHEVPDATRHERLAKDYLSAIQEGKTALVVAPTHAEGRAVTSNIRDELKTAGRIKNNERVVDQLQSHGLTEAMRKDPVNYQAGDVIRFQQNTKGGFRKGNAVTVVGVNAEGQVLVASGTAAPKPLPLDQAKHFDVYQRTDLPLAVGDRIRIAQNGMAADGKTRLFNGSLHTVQGITRTGDLKLDTGVVLPKTYGHLAHGYVTTSHASQGKTVDRVLVALGPESHAAASREQFYVSVSRGRESVAIYTPDKQELRDAVARSGERLSATDLTANAKTPVPQARQKLLRHAEHTRALRRAEGRRAVREVGDSNARSVRLRKVNERGLER